MIIVEGPDGAGKTTLIKQLVKEFGLEVAPRVVAQDTSEMTDLKTWVEENLAEGFQYKIFDRYRLISEFCYGPTLRPVQRPGFTDYLWVWQHLRLLYEIVQPVIIYCLPKLEVVKANLANDPDNEVVREHIEQIYAAYLERASLDSFLLGSKVMVWDYTLDDLVERRSMHEETMMSPDEIESNILNPFRPLMNYAKGRAEQND